MSKTVSRRRPMGIIGLVISIVTIISIFAYFSLYSDLNAGFIGNNTVSNNPDLTNHSTNNSALNSDDITSLMLVAVWIGLMIIGSYLLFHIHFKVLPEDR
ncbi:MAG: hypothetical protein ACREAD_05670 [Nitrosopumilaceae archaeon]